MKKNWLINLQQKEKDIIFNVLFSVVAVIFLLSFLFELAPVVQVNTLETLHAGSPDEALMLSVLGIPDAANLWHFSLGYGPVFWGTLKYFSIIAPEGSEIVFLRIMFMMTKYIAWLLIGWYLYKSLSRWHALVILTVLLTTPAYWFFGKIISPEYLLLLFVTITIIFFLEDNGQIKSKFQIALIFASLSTMVKLTALPFLITLILYGLIVSVVNSDNKPNVIKKYILVTMLMLSCIWLSVLFISGFEKTASDIIKMLNLAPPMQFEGRFALAWFRDAVTWDQIYAGGMKIDFIPIIMTSLFFIVLRVKKWKFIFEPRLLLVMTSVVLVFSLLFKGSAFAWYLFMPSLLFAIGMVSYIPTKGKTAVISILGMIFLLLCLIFGGAERIIQKINLKTENNLQLISNAKALNELLDANPNIEECSDNITLGFLVPNIPGRTNYMPTRIPLSHLYRETWVLPDFIVLSKYLYEKDRGPLIKHALKDKFKDYEYVDENDHLIIFAQKKLICNKINQ